MPLLTVWAIESHRPKDQPYKVSLDRGLQLSVHQRNGVLKVAITP